MSAPDTISTVEVEEYVQAVRDALAGLPAAVRDDLLEDLPDHLAEIIAEADGSLRDRLGEPVAYAAELRAAAGFPPDADGAPRGSWRAGFAQTLRRARDGAEQLDLRLGRLVGYPRFADLLRALTPGWWVLRGWLIAQLICAIGSGDRWRGVIPVAGGSRLGGAAITAAAIVVSLWMGRRSRRATAWPRGLLIAANLAIAVGALIVFNAQQSAAGNAYYGVPASAPINGGVDDVYVYDANGNLVPNARLFDAYGNPVQLGSPYCQDGTPAPGATDVNADGGTAWTYPLCPSDPSPFRSGPGALTPAATPSSAPSTAGGPTGVPTR